MKTSLAIYIPLSGLAGAERPRSPSPPACAVECSRDIISSHGLPDMNALCNNIAMLEAAFTCLARSCKPIPYGSALAHVITECSKLGVIIVDLDPVEIRSLDPAQKIPLANHQPRVVELEYTVEYTAKLDGVLTTYPICSTPPTTSTTSSEGTFQSQAPRSLEACHGPPKPNITSPPKVTLSPSLPPKTTEEVPGCEELIGGGNCSGSDTLQGPQVTSQLPAPIPGPPLPPLFTPPRHHLIQGPGNTGQNHAVEGSVSPNQPNESCSNLKTGLGGTSPQSPIPFQYCYFLDDVEVYGPQPHTTSSYDATEAVPKVCDGEHIMDDGKCKQVMTTNPVSRLPGRKEPPSPRPNKGVPKVSPELENTHKKEIGQSTSITMGEINQCQVTGRSKLFLRQRSKKPLSAKRAGSKTANSSYRTGSSSASRISTATAKPSQPVFIRNLDRVATTKTTTVTMADSRKCGARDASTNLDLEGASSGCLDSYYDARPPPIAPEPYANFALISPFARPCIAPSSTVSLESAVPTSGSHKRAHDRVIFVLGFFVLARALDDPQGI